MKQISDYFKEADKELINQFGKGAACLTSDKTNLALMFFLKDFVEELPESLPFCFDHNGSLYVKIDKES